MKNIVKFRLKYSIWQLHIQSQQKTLELYSIVKIAEFEQINAGWVLIL